MATAMQCVAKAKTFLGYSESNGKAQKYIIRPWNSWAKRNVNCKVTPWCQIYVGSVLHQMKVPYTKTAGCKQAIQYYKSIKRWKTNKTKPSCGMQIFVNGHKHTGIVVQVHDNDLLYISGNCSNTVKYTRIYNYKGNKKIDGYGTPRYN